LTNRRSLSCHAGVRLAILRFTLSNKVDESQNRKPDTFTIPEDAVMRQCTVGREFFIHTFYRFIASPRIDQPRMRRLA
jgi:hypothetical protein